jgi:alpha-tubulin suppressor-like RCC1 family protein
VPVQLGAVGQLTTNITAGGFHTCAIVAADSSVVCWGMNKDGQAGIGSQSSPVVSPGTKVKTANPSTLKPTGNVLAARSIAASMGVGQLFGAVTGGFHTVALDTAGAVWGWGNNGEFQIENLDVPPPGVITLATGGLHWPGQPPKFFKVAAGGYHTCKSGLKAGVICTGLNADGQAGGPSHDDVIPMTEGAVDLAAGAFHTCAVLGETGAPGGTVACWGNNGDEQVTGNVADGTQITSVFMLPVP